MKPEVEGRGGGFGRYKGLTLAEIQSLFDTCASDPSMRSISAVLRVTREQLEARGQLGVYPVLAWIAAAVGVVALALRAFGPEKMADAATKTALSAGSGLVLLLISTLPTGHFRRTNLQQERIIREKAAQALIYILETNPTLKPLTMEQETTVKLLLKKNKGAERLRVLLN